MDIYERFWKKVRFSEAGCWEWTATRINSGYGHFRIGDSLVVAHRVAWELSVGPIPDGMVIDHKCKNRGCVRVDHLRVVTPLENTVRGADTFNGRKTHCKNGHEFTPENTGRHGGKRYCMTCRREWSKELRERRRLSRESQPPTQTEAA